jgi:SulP family sulfate permease
MERLKVVIFDIAIVPTMDVTGLVALESAIQALSARRTHVVLVGAQPQPLALLKRTHLLDEGGGVRLADNLDHAIQEAHRLAGGTEAPPSLTSSGRWRRPTAAELGGKK